jgi:hypothetical protein
VATDGRDGRAAEPSQEERIVKPRQAVASALLLLLTAAPGPARGCGFADGVAGQRTLRQEMADSNLVVYGTLADPAQAARAASDFVVLDVLKPHPVLGGRNVLTLPALIGLDPDQRGGLLLFCDVEAGRLDPVRGLPGTLALPAYLKGLLALGGADSDRRLRYCFTFLDHADRAVARATGSAL